MQLNFHGSGTTPADTANIPVCPGRRAAPRYAGIERLEGRVLLAGQVIFPAPTQLVAKPGTEGIVLSWKGVANAFDYEVQIAPAGSSEFSHEGYTFDAETTFEDTYATPTQSFSYRVVAEFSTPEGDSLPSNVATARAPLAPPTVTTTAVSASQIDLTLDLSGDPPSSVRVSRSTDGTNFHQVAVLPAGKSSYSDRGLPEATEFYYRVRALRNGEISAARTENEITLPIAPSNLTSLAVNTNEVDFSWKNHSLRAYGVSIERSDDGGKTFFETDESQGTTDADYNVWPSSSYIYRVRSYMYAAQDYHNLSATPDLGGGPTLIESVPSDNLAISTPPEGVNDVTASGVATDAIQISWTPSINDATGFQVYGSDNGRTFRLLTRTFLPPTATTFMQKGLKPNTQHWYEVRALRGGMTTAFTERYGFTLTPAPTDLMAVKRGLKMVYLRWRSNNLPGTDFVIERTDTPFDDFKRLVDTTGTTYVDMFAAPGDNYRYRVESINSAGDYSASSNVSAVTETRPWLGYVDTTFGLNGETGGAFNGLDVGSFAVQPDGKLLIGGNVFEQQQSQFALLRLNADGSADSSFGDVGHSLPEIGSSGGITSIAIESDGKILAAGIGSQPDPVLSGWFDLNLVLLQYLPNGDLDPSFGTDGKLGISFAGLVNDSWQFSDKTCIGIKSDGHIVVAINWINVISGADVLSLAQVTADGRLDPAFGHAGIHAEPAGPSGGTLSLAVGANDRITVADGYQVFRFTSSGSYDTSFGSNGKIGLTSAATSLVVQPDGRIVMAEESGKVVRYLTSGLLDSSFAVPAVADISAYSIFLESDGDIVTVGAVQFARLLPSGTIDKTFGTSGIYGDLPFPFGPEAAVLGPDGIVVLTTSGIHPSQVELARISLDGHLDKGFGYDGIDANIEGLTSGVTNQMAVQRDGKFVVASNETAIGLAPPAAALARYNADGSLDGSFGVGGRAIVPIGSDALFNATAIETNGDIVAGGYGTSNGVRVFAISRFLPDGSADATFGTDGTVLTSFGDAKGQAYTSIAVDSADNIIAEGSTSNALAIARYLPTGALDNTFGKGGRVLLRPRRAVLQAAGMTLTAGGNIVVATTIGSAFAAMELRRDGSLDPNFGTNGMATVAFSGTGVIARAMTLDSAGNIIIAGNSDSLMAFARILPNGKPDASFGAGGGMTIDAGDAQIYSVAVESNGRIIAGGVTNHAAVIGINGTGLDESFGVYGLMAVDAAFPWATTTALALDAQGQILAGAVGVTRLNG